MIASSIQAPPPAPATLHVLDVADGLHLQLAGHWGGPELSSHVGPALARVRERIGREGGGGLALGAEPGLDWDSAGAASIWALVVDARARGLEVDDAGLPEGLRGVLALARPAGLARPDGERRTGHNLGRALWSLGHRAMDWLRDGRLSLTFTGEVLIALLSLARGRARMRGEDLLFQIDQVGPRSLPIVSLISFLVGLILAYMGADQLRRFGAQIFIADLVTIGVVREIAALMTAIILAGRVGAAFAAQLASMQANEETDALRAMGLPPVEHLVLPRVIALTLVAPLLTAYAAAVGCLAGMVVAVSVFKLTPLEYIHQSVDALTFAHVGVGLLKGTVYAALVALAGCRQGLHAGRSAQAVGDATTRAVVQAIVWIVVAASALTIVFQRFDI